MTRTLTCIVCPRGCTVTVDGDSANLTVSGNGCPRGKQYAIAECTHPVRTVTSTLRVANRRDTMVSVKTAVPVAKERMAEVMARLRETEVNAPITIGDVLLRDVCGADIVATKAIE